jgi:hypothetical protein
VSCLSILRRYLPCLALLLLLSGKGFCAPIFDYGSNWRYYLGTSEASAPDPKAWRFAGFDDSGWTDANAPIGYANPPNSTPEFNLVTLLPSSGDGNFLSVFFRKTFSVSNPSGATQIVLNVNVDDGFIAWVNGTEIGRYNVPSGDLAYDASAIVAGEPTLVAEPVTNGIPSLLLAGENVIAVQVFNANRTSSDLFFDAALESDLDETPPVVVDMTPPAWSVVPQLESIEVLFNENVQGVDPSDLLINGVPAASLNTVSPADYVFSFPQPPAGSVHVEWVPSHGITDLSPGSNAFAGGSWDYSLEPPVVPMTVMISEFMADNGNGIKNDDGTRSDWIELYNFGPDVVNLDGWFLTDNTNNLTKWRLPAFPLDAYGYLIIWGSGQNRTNPAAPLHTSFKLPAEGGYLALVSPDTNVVSDFFPSYPLQRTDVSYGRDQSDPSILGYYTTPTPGAWNTGVGSGFAPEPAFSVEEGVYTNTILTVSLSAPSGEIRYTVDGTVPGTSSLLYTNPLSVSTAKTIKARVFQDGLFPSAVIAKSYMLVDNTLATFKSKLPLMIITTSGRGIADHPAPGTTRTFGSMATLETYRGLSSAYVKPEYLGQCGISIRGQSSAGFPKKPYRLELEDAYRLNRSASLLGLPSGNDWVLNNPYTDKPFLQNFLAYELFEKMGHYSVRRRFVEVFVNVVNGRISYPRDYVGVYLLVEKIEVDQNRVPIQRLTPYDTTEPNISGGYMFKKDKDTTGDLNFSTLGGAGFSAQNLKIHEPKPREISTAQLNWLVNYLRQFERSLYATDWKTATGTNHYSWYIDVDSFVDQHWIVEYSKQIDGYRLSNYMQKDRNGKVKMEPIWDYNLSFGNADYADGWNTSGWYYNVTSADDHIWLRRLMFGTTSTSGTTGDPDFNQRIADRWSQLRTNVFAVSNVLARVDEMSSLLTDAANRDFQKWPRLGTYVWPNPSFYATPTTYAGIITAMKNWIRGRFTWIDSQFIIAPRFSLPTGRVPPGIDVSITGVGNIYYTLDGADPRLPGGARSSAATLYSGPIHLSANSRIVARTFTGTKWSGPGVSTYIIQPVLLALTEIMYHPAPPPDGSAFTADDFEFLEFKNTGSRPINLQGFRIVGGVDFSFPSYLLNTGGRVLVVKNRLAFESRYGTGLPVVGEYTGALDNSGERITVTGPFQEIVLSFAYKDSWFPITDGPGFSLVLADEALAPDRLSEPGSWRPGAAFNGSPGQPEAAAPSFPSVVINEALTRPSSGPAKVELKNLSSAPADISGWFVTDNFDKPKKFRLPPGSVIPGGGFLVLTGDDFKSPNALATFSLDPLGEEIYLFSGDSSTNLTGYFHGFKYGTQRAGTTFGRYTDSVGTESFVAQVTPTLGGQNSAPLVPPVVISEILYRPPDVALNGALWNDTEDEYIELYNRSNALVQLFDPNYPTNGWKLSGEAGFVFPPGISLGPGERLLLVNFDPLLEASQLAAFRLKYQVPAQTAIFGPYSGSLDNRGGKVTLSYPDTPLADGTVPYIVLEQISYASDVPWPLAADGTGLALARRDAAQFGADPANWSAAGPTPGRGSSFQVGPAILRQPLGQWALASQTIRLSVVASAQDTTGYQWRCNGANLLGATNATLTLTNVQPAQAGDYLVIVLGTNSATLSSTAQVIIGRDYDGDGMDDDWELAQGFNPFDPADALIDTDGDGVPNRDEFIGGTNPHDPADYLRLDRVTRGSVTTLSFRAAAYHTYAIQFTGSLDQPDWKTLAEFNSQPSVRIAAVDDQANGTCRYYRLITPSPP